MTTTRLWIAGFIFPMTNAVLFGLGAVPLLAIPALTEHIWTLFPIHIASSFILAAPISWMIAPRLRARYWREQELR